MHEQWELEKKYYNQTKSNQILPDHRDLYKLICKNFELSLRKPFTGFLSNLPIDYNAGDIMFKIKTERWTEIGLVEVLI